MTSKICSPGFSSCSETVPWQKFRPWYGLSLMEMNRFSPSGELRTASTPRQPDPFRHARILWMERHPHLVLLGHRNDPLEEVGDALPVGVRVDLAGDGQRRILLRAGVDELAVARGPAPGRRARARHAQQREVVLHLVDARLRAVADHLADVVDVAIAIRVLAQEDRGHLGARDLRGAHGQGHHVERDPVRRDALAALRQGVHRPRVIHLPGGQAAADVVHAERRAHAKDVLGIPLLRADLHPGLRRGLRGRRRGLGRCLRHLRRDDRLREGPDRDAGRRPAPASRTNSRRFMGIS